MTDGTVILILIMTTTQTKFQPIIEHVPLHATQMTQAEILTSQTSGDSFTANKTQLSFKATLTTFIH